MNVEEIRALLLKHDFKLERQVGQGGYSKVFLVSSIRYQEPFCVKVMIDQELLADSTEVRSCTNLFHNNIIKIYEYFQEGCYSFIVFEYCSGGSLQALIEEEGPLTDDMMMIYAKQLVDTLIYCHSLHIAHRDIKPSNLLIDKNGRLKLADFGLSKKMDPNDKINDNFPGSILYMAPEIMECKEYDPFLADIWSLGVTFYQMITGETPWGTTNLRKIQLAGKMKMINFPPGVNFFYIKLIRAMLVDKPDKRASLFAIQKAFIDRENKIHPENQEIGRINNKKLCKSVSVTTGKNRNIMSYQDSSMNKRIPSTFSTYEICNNMLLKGLKKSTLNHQAGIRRLSFNND